MVTREEIQELALLAKLSIDEDKLDELTQAMGDMIAFADTINAASEAGTEFDNIGGLSNVFREDQVLPSFPREEILQNVQGGEDGYFPVRRRG